MYKTKKITAIIVAGGSSQRMGFDKLYYKISGKEVLWHSVNAFCKNELIDEIVVAAAKGAVARAQALLSGFEKTVKVVEGGKERNESVINALKAATDADYIAVHDAARPFVSQKIITETILLAVQTGAAAPAVPVKDTIKRINADGTVKNTPCREELRAIQTPQVFLKQNYIKALAMQNGKTVTDDCMVMENAGFTVALSLGEYKNIKITTKEDLPVENTRIDLRIGHGYDVHRLVPGRRFILGGVEIPHETGLLGHSDADVLLHAISDSLLGAASLGDIGRHFPDSDDRYKNADSICLLRRVNEILNENGWCAVNIDATVLCQKPKLAPHIEKMKSNIAAALGTEKENISVKATTEEGLGFTGEETGVAAHAVAMIRRL